MNKSESVFISVRTHFYQGDDFLVRLSLALLTLEKVGEGQDWDHFAPRCFHTRPVLHNAGGGDRVINEFTRLVLLSPRR